MTIYNNPNLNWPACGLPPPTPTPHPVPLAIPNGGTGAIGSSLYSNQTTSYNLGVGQTTNSSAFQIRNDTEPVMTINTDGKIVTKAGTISVDDWIQVVKLMKQFIVDVSNDEETSKKYPYLKDAAHQWMMDELRK